MWTEKNTPYGFRLVENEGGATLGYSPDSGALALRSLMAGVDQMGGCKNDWVKDEQGQEHNYYCAAFRALLDYAAPRFQNIARAELNARRGMQ